MVINTLFGYIRPDKSNMLVKEYELYKSVYCALCKQLEKDYGIFAKSILSYDSTFFCIVSASLVGAKPEIEHHRCTVNPLKQCKFCTSLTPHLKMAAAFTVISFYYKLYDDIKDERFFKSLLCRFLLLFAKRYRKKALKNFAHYDKIVEKAITNQREYEKDKNISIDKSADPTAVMLKELMQTLATTEKEKNIYGNFGYFLGRWIYLIDACDDISDDLKNENFNPFIYKFDLKKETYNIENFSYQFNEILNMTASELVLSYNEMQIKSFKTITDNVILKGIGEMQKHVLFCKNKKKEKI